MITSFVAFGRTEGEVVYEFADEYSLEQARKSSETVLNSESLVIAVARGYVRIWWDPNEVTLHGAAMMRFSNDIVDLEDPPIE